ncbi:MAG: hypothetical protein U0R66_10670 [Mycobacterium sp.]
MTRPPRQYYDDGQVQLDRYALTLRRYHFPSGTAKVIPLRLIKGYRAESLGVLMQRFRIWGSSDLRRWLPLDIRRPLKSVLITLDVPGTWPSPAFTPEDPEEFVAMFEELLGQRNQPGQGSQTS